LEKYSYSSHFVAQLRSAVQLMQIDGVGGVAVVNDEVSSLQENGGEALALGKPQPQGFTESPFPGRRPNKAAIPGELSLRVASVHKMSTKVCVVWRWKGVCEEVGFGGSSVCRV